MINIKEAGRYANFLQDKINILMNYLENEDVIFTITEEHQKSKALKTVSDETNTREANELLDISIEDAVFLVKHLIDSKMNLSMAISYAKSNLLIDWTQEGKSLHLDTAIEYSKNLRNFATYSLKNLCDKKAREYEMPGRDHLINKEGNQSEYFYNIKVVQKINYNRKIVKDQYKKMLKKADLLSEQIDSAMLKKIIDYDMEYSFHDSLEDIVEIFNKK